MKYLKLFTSHSDYNAAKSDLDKPNVSHCILEHEVHYNPWVYDYSQDYLTFVALENGTFQLSRNTVSYSLDNGETWTELAANTASPTVAAGNKIIWKGTITPSSSYGVGTFSATGNFDVQGNPMSILYGDNYKGQTDLTGKNYAFYQLFSGSTKVVNAENLSLPATTLTRLCYAEMFSGCTSLTTAPQLPATTLAERCYSNMFNGCTNLTTAPQLPAATLVGYCYQSMFRNCTNLTTAPELPATTLAEVCYGNMFDGCTNLTTAPRLPVTTLANNCYLNMFRNCTSLVTAPELPATTLKLACYNNMFDGCTSLNYIKAMFTTTPGGSCISWVNGVSATGTFVKNSAAEWDVTGVNGIPSGWTVQTASE